MIPVNVRTEEQHERLGNQVSMMVARLPLDERDPRRRLQRVSENVRELKHSRQALGVRTLEEAGDWALPSIFTAFTRLAAATRPYNIVVTNVPGPPVPAYLLGSRMEAIYPLVPLFRNQGLGVALFSYDGSLFWGFNADWDAIPDLHDLVRAVEREFSDLRRAAAPEAAVIRVAAAKRNSRRPRPATPRVEKPPAKKVRLARRSQPVRVQRKTAARKLRRKRAS
jgi:hypothetical protein